MDVERRAPSHANRWADGLAIVAEQFNGLQYSTIFAFLLSNVFVVSYTPICKGCNTRLASLP